tara:strand:- start:186 stop:455 length:270 start_codon:yes stop_codon:yes gene_type:complete
MGKFGMKAVDLAISNGVDLDGTPIPEKMLKLYKSIMDQENKRVRSGVKKSMRNRCVKTGSKYFDKETLNKLLIEAGWDGLNQKEVDFFF